MTIERQSLEPGERLLWEGRPDFKAYLENNAFPLHRPGIAAAVLAFGLLVAGRAYFLPGEGYEEVAMFAFVASAILVYARYRLRRDARGIRYALTDKRAIVDRPGSLLRNNCSVPFSEACEITVHYGEYGDLIFAYTPPDLEAGSFHPIGFYAIENVREVEQILRSAIAGRVLRQSPGVTA
jgi:hypothetical protein